jgi:hypothetical protein
MFYQITKSTRTIASKMLFVCLLGQNALGQTGGVTVSSSTNWAAGTCQLTSVTVQSGAVVVTGNSTIILQGADTAAQVNGAWAGS